MAVGRAPAGHCVDGQRLDGRRFGLASCACAGSRALAGQSAAHGTIGWGALARDDGEGTLDWVAVSEGSNPFSEVTLDEATVTATSTAGRIRTFPETLLSR
jgi:hypothetical protein